MFTENEKGLLADGLLVLLENENQAIKFTHSEEAKENIQKHQEMIRALLNKILEI